MNWEVIQSDCLEAMRVIPDGSIDACITDPPYGTTACSWDSVIPFAPMWAALKRVVKKNGAIVLFGSQPFTSALVMSNPQMFKYEWSWDKRITGSPWAASFRPLMAHENILVFGQGVVIYNPQMIERSPDELKRLSYETKISESVSAHAPHLKLHNANRFDNKLKHPSTVVRITGVLGRSNEKVEHPTQKPVELMRYLVRTYTNKGDTILDFTCGSGSTGVACAIERRDFIGIEQDEHYYEVARARISRACGVPADVPTRNNVERDLPLFR